MAELKVFKKPRSFISFGTSFQILGAKNAKSQ